MSKNINIDKVTIGERAYEKAKNIEKEIFTNKIKKDLNYKVLYKKYNNDFFTNYTNQFTFFGLEKSCILFKVNLDNLSYGGGYVDSFNFSIELNDIAICNTTIYSKQYNNVFYLKIKSENKIKISVTQEILLSVKVDIEIAGNISDNYDNFKSLIKSSNGISLINKTQNNFILQKYNNLNDVLSNNPSISNTYNNIIDIGNRANYLNSFINTLSLRLLVNESDNDNYSLKNVNVYDITESEVYTSIFDDACFIQLNHDTYNYGIIIKNGQNLLCNLYSGINVANSFAIENKNSCPIKKILGINYELNSEMKITGFIAIDVLNKAYLYLFKPFLQNATSFQLYPTIFYVGEVNNITVCANGDNLYISIYMDNETVVYRYIVNHSYNVSLVFKKCNKLNFYNSNMVFLIEDKLIVNNGNNYSLFDNTLIE